MSDFGDIATRWTVRLALLCYFAAMMIRLRRDTSTGRALFARWLFTLGCALFTLHVIAAFEFFHLWSHAHALEETARRTEELTGILTGLGLWLNYLFTLLWIIETVFWLRRYEAPMGPIRIAVHGFMLFIIFNATAVFETGAVRWLGAVGCAMIIILGAIRWRTDGRLEDPPEVSPTTPHAPHSPLRPDGKSQ